MSNSSVVRYVFVLRNVRVEEPVPTCNSSVEDDQDILPSLVDDVVERVRVGVLIVGDELSTTDPLPVDVVVPVPPYVTANVPLEKSLDASRPEMVVVV